ncbi:MAG: hypothetical protein EBY32_18960, partial [Proteobacteria bacterium]|nr:hypothetical protein [Pseudomonadota bacterium]
NYAITQGTLSAGSNYAITFVGANFTIKLPLQTISFPAIDSKTFGDAAFTLNATASSGLPVSYSSSNSAIATVSNNGVVTVTGAGVATITASQSGSPNFAAANNVTQTLAVKPLISASGINAEAILNQAYSGYTFSASGSNSTKTWSISSGNLPPGMTLNATTGTLSGTPTVSGDYGFTINVTCAGTSNEAELGFSVYDSDAVRLALKKYAQMVTIPSGALPEGSMFVGEGVPIFQIGKYEVTWSEWQRVRTWALANGYTDLANVGAGNGDDHPVQSVNWYDAVKWCNAKSQMESLTPVYRIGASVYKTGEIIPTLDSTASGYRLPAEVEWEWAARGATQSKGYTYSGSSDVNAVGWYSLNSGNSTKAVGTKTANELRLFDMSGNVWEWAWDASATLRALRGGSYTDLSSYCSNVNRNPQFPGLQVSNAGFRLARNIGPKISITGTMPVGTLDQPYLGYSFSAGGTTATKVWSISDGSLPSGMTLNSSTG